MASRQEHYDGGEYEFNGIVLSWQPETFQSKKRLKHLDTLPTTHSDSDDYYDSFMPHIIEETCKIKVAHTKVSFVDFLRKVIVKKEKHAYMLIAIKN